MGNKKKTILFVAIIGVLIVAALACLLACYWIGYMKGSVAGSTAELVHGLQFDLLFYDKMQKELPTEDSAAVRDLFRKRIESNWLSLKVRAAAAQGDTEEIRRLRDALKQVMESPAQEAATSPQQ